MSEQITYFGMCFKQSSIYEFVSAKLFLEHQIRAPHCIPVNSPMERAISYNAILRLSFSETPNKGMT
jgi:hypothetical protein